VLALFQLSVHSKDLPLLNKIQSFFGGIGNIYVTTNSKGQMATFLVSKIDDIINVIVPHFKTYQLQSEKKVDFQLWQECAELMKNKEHLSEKGLNKILSLKSALNLGLTEKLKKAFPNVILVSRPVLSPDQTPLDPN